MKRVCFMFLMLMLLLPVQGFAEAAAEGGEPIPWQLERRIIFSRDECFIVRDDGTVFMNRAAKEEFPEAAQWTDIREISISSSSMVGLKTDGTVIATGPANSFGKLDTGAWTDIVQVEATIWCTYALNSKGELLYVGHMPEEDQAVFDRYEWKNLKQIESDGWYLFALTEDGHVLSTFDDDFSEMEYVEHIFCDYIEQSATFIHDDGSQSFYSTYGHGFVHTYRRPYPVVQVTYFAYGANKSNCPNFNALDTNGKIRAYGFSPYVGFDAEDVVAVCGGIYVDGDGVLHSIVDVEAEEALPVFDLGRYFAGE